jgi:hypothetical protein
LPYRCLRLRVTLPGVMRKASAAAAATLLSLAAPAAGHPLPLSVLDVRVDGDLQATLTMHAFDLGRALGVPAAALLDAGQPASHGAAIAAVAGRLSIEVDGQIIPARWSAPELDDEQQSLRVRLRGPLPAAPAALRVHGPLFPDDPAHQIFVNVYEGATLERQAILDGSARLDHPLGSRATPLSVARKFGAAGIAHIMSGVDHLLFLVGLLLLGGSRRRLLLIVSAFTVGHSITLSLAALALVQPPARLVEPAIALTIVCVGADNLLAGGGRGRDLRPLFALAFGLIHGFGFAGALRQMGLPRGALAWSLAAFNGGVEVGQLVLVALVATGLAALRARSEQAGRRLALVGSVGVTAAGAFWFIQRLFFLGGIS